MKTAGESYVLFKTAARNRSERVDAPTLPLDGLISSSQSLSCREFTFTLSAVSIIGLWFYSECASVKGRAEGKYEHCATPGPLHLHTLPCRAV